MCGRYALLKPEDIIARFRATNQLEGLAANDDVRPTQLAPVIAMNHEAKLMRWGLIPSWAKDATIAQKLINARAEGLDQKPSFRKSLHSSRCIVPATGFYEWQAAARGKKQKYLFHRADDEMFGFAGLYDTWVDSAGQPRETFTIITTTPNEVVAPVHDRMPVILRKAAEEIWLDADEDDSDLLMAYLKPLPAEELVAQAF